MPISEQPKQTVVYGILLTILILLVLFVTGYFSYQSHRKLVAAEHWVPIQAVIKSENVYVMEASGMGRSRSPRQDCLKAIVIYAFKNSSYEKNFLIDCQASSTESDVQVGQQLRQAYPINSKIDIRFNPQQPEEAMTATEFKFLSDHSIGNDLKAGLKKFGMVVISIFCIVLSILLFAGLGLLFGWWKKSPSTKRPPSIFDYEP
ncbi:MAG: DUF3592 domain-containing protein [Gammaproteobacteria bacterium]|nr:DUF3592 domain-containing protein [Gammaproteobacteria bacterium]